MSLVEYTREGQIGYITLNRPEKLNAISDEMSLALCDALYAFYDDEEAMIAILSGNGRAFCSGADVKQRQLRPKEELKKLGGPSAREGNIRHPFFKPPHAKPIIAAMHSDAIASACIHPVVRMMTAATMTPMIISPVRMSLIPALAPKARSSIPPTSSASLMPPPRATKPLPPCRPYGSCGLTAAAGLHRNACKNRCGCCS